MAQEDKGLVLRGIVLLAFVGALATFVLAVIFWRSQPPAPVSEPYVETAVAALVAPTLSAFPSHVWWPAVVQAGQNLPSEPGFEIRYNAAATLARRGSANVPWPLIREMLDENLQRRNHGSRLPDGKYAYDEGAARENIISTLKALAAWHEKQPESHRQPSPALADVYARVDELAQSSNVALKSQAETTRKTFFR